MPSTLKEHAAAPCRAATNNATLAIMMARVALFVAALQGAAACSFSVDGITCNWADDANADCCALANAVNAAANCALKHLPAKGRPTPADKQELQQECMRYAFPVMQEAEKLGIPVGPGPLPPVILQLQQKCPNTLMFFLTRSQQAQQCPHPTSSYRVLK